MKGILGRKVGMTQIYSATGISIPVTIIEVKPNVVTQVHTLATSGYQALQLGLETLRKSRQTKPLLGHSKKANTTPKRFTKEIRGMTGYNLGQTLDVSLFEVGELVDVTGQSKGHGFTGAIKRHNQKIGPQSHGGGGGSKPTRLTGSLGDISGNKVVKGMTMPGQYGHKQKTIQNLEVVFCDLKQNVLLVKGSIPGPRKSYVVIKSAIKQLPSKTPFKMLNLQETLEKNELIEEAKHLNLNLNTTMKLTEMQQKVAAEKAQQQQEVEGEKPNDGTNK